MDLNQLIHDISIVIEILGIHKLDKFVILLKINLIQFNFIFIIFLIKYKRLKNFHSKNIIFKIFHAKVCFPRKNIFSIIKIFTKIFL